MKRSSPRAWDLVGCGVLVLLFIFTELAFALQIRGLAVFATSLVVSAPPLALGTLLVVAGLFGRKWRSRRSDLSADRKELLARLSADYGVSPETIEATAAWRAYPGP